MRASFWSVFSICFGFISCAFPQSALSSSATTPKGSPIEMRLCIDFCATLTWDGHQYLAIRDGESAPWAWYTIDKWSPEEIQITGSSLERNGDGVFITGVFTGKLSLSVGTVSDPVVHWKIGKLTGSRGYQLTWASSTAPGKPPEAGTLTNQLPQSMRFCAFYCFILSLNGDHYDARREGAEDLPVTGTYKVSLFTSDNVLFRRVDVGGGTATLVGRISPDGNSISDGKITWHKDNGEQPSFPFQMTWGAAYSQAHVISQTRQPSESAQASGLKGDESDQVARESWSKKRPGDPPHENGANPVARSRTEDSGATDEQSPRFPERFTECEANKCGTGFFSRWRFHGKTGLAISQNGVVAKLEVTAFDGTNVEIRRTDTVDSVAPGLTAVYKGAFFGENIHGTEIVTWPGHLAEPITESFAADVEPLSEDKVFAAWEFKCAPVPGYAGIIRAPLMAANYFKQQKNDEQYFCWTQTAAIFHEDPLGAYLLAAMYGGGIGVAKDPVLGWKWAQIAEQRGRPLPQEATKELAREVLASGQVQPTREDIARGISILGPLLSIMTAEPKYRNETSCTPGAGCYTTKVPY